ncbi:Crp/Fnr family transcriptional regulator [Flammeovirga sp. SJP92]|uniref:Crp/Fnr family transcriptional regulator n=1 Tax=Flammeovirga sp. SJP92 TaxID=1775430 RepID=UPI00078701CC|nr:Crp/Fnr family transcriptional regulator [Flammeovirga sp. SJP92]KXX71058.1 cyclic nucleotide-binding protein [Flammeovirga sp. SJP92]
MSTNKLIEHISKFIQLDEEEINAISNQIQVRKYKTGDILLSDGDISTVSYFNLEGCVRLYHLVDGEEKTAFFYTENCFISSIRSFTTGAPSNHYLECIEDCVLALIPYDVEKELLMKYPKLETFARISLEQELANYQEILSSFIISNPEQRYLNLQQKQPELLQRVPLYHLASYIGVKAESLSRIRKRISRKTS